MAEEKKADVKKPVRRRERPSAAEFFGGVKTELKKVIWPTKKELVTFTVVVVVTCLFFALLFWAIDSGVLAFLKGILGVTI